MLGGAAEDIEEHAEDGEVAQAPLRSWSQSSWQEGRDVSAGSPGSEARSRDSREGVIASSDSGAGQYKPEQR